MGEQGLAHRWFVAGAAWLLFALPLLAQQDTLLLDKPSMSRVQRITLASAVIPGSGQIANGQWWKAPLVWGGLGYAGWSVAQNQQELRRSVDGLVALDNGEPLPEELVDANGNPLSESLLNERALFYRRNRDLSAIGWLVIHALQVLDANTGATLRAFDTSDDLSAHWGWALNAPTVRLVWRPQPKSSP